MAVVHNEVKGGLEILMGLGESRDFDANKYTVVKVRRVSWAKAKAQCAASAMIVWH